jgi:hypothetical protein
MVSAVLSIGGRLAAAGASIMSQLVSGITSRIGAAVSAVSGAVSRIAGLLPGSPVKEGPLRVLNNGYAGGQIALMLAAGINARRREVEMAAKDLADLVALHTGSPGAVMGRIVGSYDGAPGLTTARAAGGNLGSAAGIVVQSGAVQVTVDASGNADPAAVKVAVGQAVDDSFDKLIAALRRR